MTENYRHTLDALGLCVSAGIPAILWGNPGEGKTSMIESAAQNAGWMVETVILSQSEPSDLAGLPIVSGDGNVVLAPPAWAQRLAEHDGPAICFFDEFSTAAPSLQAAALRILTHRQVGRLQLPESVTFVAAANPVDVAAAGWELAAPTASRFVHVDYAMALDVFAQGSVTGRWPSLPTWDLPDDFAARVKREGLGDAVRFIGYLDRAEALPACYAAADVFVFASRTETQGLVLLEAMAAGLPVVALAEMGTVDILGPRRASLAPPPEPEAFGEAVGRLLGDASARQRLAADASAYAAEWSDTEMAARLAWLYRDLLERHAPAGVPAVAGA